MWGLGAKVKNIKKHAKYNKDNYADSYFNFYYDSKTDTYKFHIIDNLNTGFINAYIKTLENDKKELEEKKLNTEKFYTDALEIIKDTKNDIGFLKSFFSEKGWFKAQKIPRIIFHFGIPLLISILKNTQGKAHIRLHRNHNDSDKFYKIIIESKAKNSININPVEIKNKEEQIKGTYIYIEIPNTEYEKTEPASRTFGTKEYKFIENKKMTILDEMKKFIEGAKKKEKYLIKTYDNEKNISDFIKNIYIEAHQNNITDILILNIDIKSNIQYLKTLIYLLYFKKDTQETTKENTIIPINVLFWDNSSFDVFFIGGKDAKEFSKSNQLLYSYYGQKNYLEEWELYVNDKNSKPAQSIFFITDNNQNFAILPFELYKYLNAQKSISDDIWEKLSPNRVIINYLEKNKLNIHFDTQKGYHVDGFYKFDTIFQNSSYFRRLAFILIAKLEKEISLLKDKKLIFIGFGKYLNFFIAHLIDMLSEKHIDVFERYRIIDGLEKKEEIKIFLEKPIKQFKKNSSSTKEPFVIFITSVIFEGKKSNEFIKYITEEINIKYKWYNLIQIGVNENFSKNNNFESLIFINISKNYYSLNNPCPICSNPEKEKPLLRLDKEDEFKLEKTYFSKYEKKTFKSLTKVDDVKFYNSISFGHISRGKGNHYLYYTKTVSFFEDNKNKKENNILKFLTNIKEKNNFDNPSNAILLVPMHCTVNRFASMVQNVIFNGEAKIFQFDTKKGIKNFHELKEQLNDNVNDYKFYYIDDEISSGYTLEYFYSLIRYCGKTYFEKIFILVDRTDKQEETLILNYIKDNNIDNIHIFTKMEIKPIKTAIEECFLCNSRKKYKEILKNTSLDMNRFAIANRIVKLNITSAKLYDFEERKEFNTKDFRLYLKMFAADYVYDNFEDIYLKETKHFIEMSREDILNHYNKIEKSFIEKVQNKIEFIAHSGKEKNFIKKIGEYEGKIALMKALSFPKIVYYYNIRYMLTIVLIDRIKNYLNEDPIQPIFDYKRQLHYEKNISNNFKDAFDSLYKHFSKKINMHFISFLHKTASYLNIHYTIHYHNVKYYYISSKKIRDRDKDKNVPMCEKLHIEQSLLHYYQLAAKMVAEYSEDRAKYLLNNIDKLFKNQNIEGYDSLLGALIIENHYDKNIVDFQKKVKNLSDKNTYEVFKQFEKMLKIITKDNTLKIQALYINQYADLEYNSYKEYLDKMYLIDVINEFKEPLKKEEDLVYQLVKGYLSARKNEIFDPDNSYHKENINNTWSNLYSSDYIIDGKPQKTTLIKLVDINPNKLDTNPKEKIKNTNDFVKDNNSLWYKPIGCILITYKEKNRKNHLKLSKYILAVQTLIVNYIKNKFSSGVIQESIEKTKIREEVKKEYEDIISNINHSVKEYLNLKAISEHIINIENHNIFSNELKKHILDLRIYSFGLWHLSSIAELKTSNCYKKQGVNIYKIFYKDNGKEKNFLKNLKSFIKIANDFLPSKFLKIEDDINITDNANNNYLILDFKDICVKHLVFEIIFNAIKCKTDDGYQTIKIELIENGIIFKNKLRKSDSSKAIEKINGTLSKKIKGFGIKTIREVINNSNGKYKINSWYNNDTQEINISIKGEKNAD